MEARDEQRSLAENPLPPALPSKVNPLRCPSYIAELDRDIQEHTEAITKLRELRENALEYAITNKILEDEDIQIVKKERNLPREVNKDLLKEKKPAIYEAARSIEITNATEKIQKQIDALNTSDPTIRIKTLQSLMSEAEIDEICFPHKITVSWEVKKMKNAPALPKGEKDDTG
jgi:hypothetical protein